MFVIIVLHLVTFHLKNTYMLKKNTIKGQSAVHAQDGWNTSAHPRKGVHNADVQTFLFVPLFGLAIFFSIVSFHERRFFVMYCEQKVHFRKQMSFILDRWRTRFLKL